MTKVCFCVLIGDYDTLQNPTFINNDWDYICITDQNIKSDIWKIIKVENNDLDSRWFSRYIFTHFYEYINYDIIIKCDTNMIIMGDLNELIKYLNNENDLVLIEHPRRKCIYDEANAVNKRFPEYSDIVNKQIEQYKNEGYPEKNGLHMQGIRIIINNDKVKNAYKLWWKEIEKGSWRDQLSFEYIQWKLKNTKNELNIGEIPYYDIRAKYFKFIKHKN